jgi:hypothetical protein
MARVEIIDSLKKEIFKKFKSESIKILRYLKKIEESPNKGKILGNVGGVIIKEVKYNGFRFYFITDGFKIKFLEKEKLEELLIRFVRMSDKKSQQKTIDEIKHVLRNFGEEGF